jgi:hypothetical protein
MTLLIDDEHRVGGGVEDVPEVRFNRDFHGLSGDAILPDSSVSRYEKSPT